MATGKSRSWEYGGASPVYRSSNHRAVPRVPPFITPFHFFRLLSFLQFYYTSYTTLSSYDIFSVLLNIFLHISSVESTHVSHPLPILMQYYNIKDIEIPFVSTSTLLTKIPSRFSNCSNFCKFFVTSWWHTRWLSDSSSDIVTGIKNFRPNSLSLLKNKSEDRKLSASITEIIKTNVTNERIVIFLEPL